MKGTATAYSILENEVYKDVVDSAPLVWHCSSVPKQKLSNIIVNLGFVAFVIAFGFRVLKLKPYNIIWVYNYNNLHC